MRTTPIWFSRTRAFWTKPEGRRLQKALQVILTVAIVGYLIVRLSGIGWSNIIRELPSAPLFYVFFLLLYFSLPIGEVLVYRVVWGRISVKGLFSALVRKRVLNRDVLGYSGELFLYGWARKHVVAPEREILKSIRDTNIVSSVASTLIAVALLAVFLYLGHFSIRTWIDGRAIVYVILGMAGTAIVAAVLWRFRRFIFSMAPRIALLVFVLYAVRLILGQILQIAQWAVVLPDVAVGVWFTFAAVSLVISRVPFLPSQDLVFLGAGVELSSMMDVPTASVAGMLLVVGVLDKVVNAVLFLGISVWERRKARRQGRKLESDARQDAAVGDGMASTVSQKLED